MDKKDKIQKLIQERTDGELVFGSALCIEQPEKGFRFNGTAGNLKKSDVFFMASTTKLYITAVFLQLFTEKQIDLDDPVISFFQEGQLKDLLVWKGKDVTSLITLRHLLSHTSGLPDYFQGKKKGSGNSLLKEISSGTDQSWSFEDILELTKKMPPAFYPGTPGKALYSDTNFQLLGRVIELIYQKSLDDVLADSIFNPLGLTQTYMYRNPNDRQPKPFFYKKTEALLPQAMTSFGPDGGLVSNATEMMIFLKAFFSGGLFPVSIFKELENWNPIFFPLEYGTGISRFKIPWYFSPFKRQPVFIGHSGLSGAFAFYVREKGLFLTGTVNPGLCIRILKSGIYGFNF